MHMKFIDLELLGESMNKYYIIHTCVQLCHNIKTHCRMMVRDLCVNSYFTEK